MKIISNYLEEDGIGKQRSRYRSRRRRRRRRRRTFPFGRRQNEDGVRAGRHFATGARSAAAWPWSTWMKEERESEKDKTRGLVSPPPPFSNSVLGTFDYYLFICQNHQDRNLQKKIEANAKTLKVKTKVKLCNIQSLFLIFLCTF